MAVPQESNRGRAPKVKPSELGGVIFGQPRGGLDEKPLNQGTKKTQPESIVLSGSRSMDSGFNAIMNRSWLEYRRRAFD